MLISPGRIDGKGSHGKAGQGPEGQGWRPPSVGRRPGTEGRKPGRGTWADPWTSVPHDCPLLAFRGQEPACAVGLPPPGSLRQAHGPPSPRRPLEDRAVPWAAVPTKGRLPL